MYPKHFPIVVAISVAITASIVATFAGYFMQNIGYLVGGMAFAIGLSMLLGRYIPTKYAVTAYEVLEEVKSVKFFLDGLQIENRAYDETTVAQQLTSLTARITKLESPISELLEALKRGAKKTTSPSTNGQARSA